MTNMLRFSDNFKPTLVISCQSLTLIGKEIDPGMRYCRKNGNCSGAPHLCTVRPDSHRNHYSSQA